MRVVIIGGGEVVYFLTRTFISKGYPVSVVNDSAHECEQLARSLKALVINGDGSDPNVLEDARAREAQLLIAVTPYDHINLVCCQTAALLFKIPRTLALVNDPDNYEIFRQLGIDHVFNQTDLIVSMLEKQVEYAYLTHIFSYSNGQALFNEVLLKETMPAVGQRLGDTTLGKKAKVVGIVREGSFFQIDMNEDQDVRFHSGDRVLILTDPESLAPTLRTLCGEEA